MTSPERLARIDAMAREWARFHMPVNDPSGTESPRAIYWRVMQPIIAAATSCRLFELPRQEREYMAPKAASAATLRYLQRSRGRTEVAMKEAGVREDVDFWWTIVEGELKRPIFTVPLNLLDQVALFSSGDCVVFGTLKYDLPSSAIQFAKSQVAAGDAVCLLPIVHGAVRQVEVVRLVVFAAPDVAAKLARVSAKQGINADKPHELDGNIGRTFPPMMYDAMMLTFNLDIVGIRGGNPERRLQLLLRHATKRGDSASIKKALATAEVIASMEKRPVERRAEWSAPCLDTLNHLETWSADQDMLTEETVVLARATVASITPERAIDPTVRTIELRKSLADNWRVWLSDLLRRLDAAIVGRRVRATSPNAAPHVLTRKTLAQLANPEAWKGFYFYALQEDAQALLDFVREETGARVYTRISDGGLQERPSAWDCRQALSGAFDGRFDEREIAVWGDHRNGIKFFVWWPDVHPQPHAERPLESVGWGITDFLFRGGKVSKLTRDGIPTQSHLILRSVFEYPTGSELRRPRYQSEGPWRDVDWKALRRKIRDVRAYIKGPLSKATAPPPGREPILEHAAIRRDEGWKLADKYGTSILLRERKDDTD